MARKAILNRDTVLQMLHEGQTTQRVADHFGVTRQAVDIHRKEFIALGLLADQRAHRSKQTALETPVQPSLVPPVAQSPPEMLSHQIEPVLPVSPSPRELAALPLDQIIDAAIDAFAALKRLPFVEAERDSYRQSYQDATIEIARLREAESHRQAQEQRWFHAQR